MGFLRPDLLFPLVQEQVKHIIFSTYAWPEGTFTLTEGEQANREEAIFNIPDRDLDSLCFEQSQIKVFVHKYKKWLRAEGYATLFLFKVGEGVNVRAFVVQAFDPRFFHVCSECKKKVEELLGSSE